MIWTGSSRSIQLSSLPIGTPLGPVKRGPADEQADHALGRDAPAFPEAMARLRVPRPIGRPRTTPVMVLADKAYASRAIRTHLRRRGIRAVIPQPLTRQAANRKRRGGRGSRRPAFDRDAHKQRNMVERCINRLGRWRGLAIRYDKTAVINLAALHLAGVFIWSAR